jgi:hypothetical protein
LTAAGNQTLTKMKIIKRIAPNAKPPPKMPPISPSEGSSNLLKHVEDMYNSQLKLKGLMDSGSSSNLSESPPIPIQASVSSFMLNEPSSSAQIPSLESILESNEEIG